MASQKDPDEYMLIEYCVAGPEVNLGVGANSPSIYAGCKCHGNCLNVSSSANNPCSCRIAYEKGGQLCEAYMLPYSQPIFECNTKCTCSTDCINRVTQCYSCLSVLSAFQTDRKGIGVRTKEYIPRGTFVGEYVGEVLSSTQVKQRLESLRSEESCYIVQYKEHTDNGNILTTNIDAKHKGNLTRFINHSCSPNLVMVPIRIDSILPRLCLFACRNIETNEEVCFSYFGKAGKDIDPTSTEIKFGKKQCLCESKECVGFLPLQR